jgi:hypothetical protein
LVVEGFDTSTDVPSFLSQKSYKFLQPQSTSDFARCAKL